MVNKTKGKGLSSFNSHFFIRPNNNYFLNLFFFLLSFLWNSWPLFLLFPITHDILKSITRVLLLNYWLSAIKYYVLYKLHIYLFYIKNLDWLIDWLIGHIADGEADRSSALMDGSSVLMTSWPQSAVSSGAFSATWCLCLVWKLCRENLLGPLWGNLNVNLNNKCYSSSV